MAPSEVTPLGFAPQTVLAFVAGPPAAELTWPDGKKTNIAFAIEQPRTYFVQSEPDPDFGLDIPVQCKDFILVEGVARISTEDGQINERWQTAGIRSIAADRADLVLSVKRAAMRGKYEPLTRTTECVSALQFNITFTPTRFSGTLLDTVARVPCSEVKPTTGVSPRRAGNWGDSQPTGP